MLDRRLPCEIAAYGAISTGGSLLNFRRRAVAKNNFRQPRATGCNFLDKIDRMTRILLQDHPVNPENPVNPVRMKQALRHGKTVLRNCVSQSRASHQPAKQSFQRPCVAKQSLVTSQISKHFAMKWFNSILLVLMGAGFIWAGIETRSPFLMLGGLSFFGVMCVQWIGKQ